MLGDELRDPTPAEEKLRRVAALYASKYGWHVKVRYGAFERRRGRADGGAAAVSGRAAGACRLRRLSPSGRILALSRNDAAEVVLADTQRRRVRARLELDLGGPPAALAWVGEERFLVVSPPLEGESGSVHVVDAVRCRTLRTAT